MIDFAELRETGKRPRIHGNGFIQIDLPTPGDRIHVFGHPEVPRQIAPTPVHDHAWGFRSLVLGGCLVNIDWRFSPFETDHTHYVCTYEPSGKGEDDTRLIPHLDKTGALRPMGRSLMQGRQGYNVYPGEFHETFANEPTITFMSKTHTDLAYKHRPRVLCRIGQEPDNGFNRHDAAGEDDIWRMVESAFRWCGL